MARVDPSWHTSYCEWMPRPEARDVSGCPGGVASQTDNESSRRQPAKSRKTAQSHDNPVAHKLVNLAYALSKNRQNWAPLAP